MQSNDKPINGQENPSFLDLLNQLPPVSPAPEPNSKPGTQQLARLRTAWRKSWEEGGFLYERWEDLFQARRLGWHEMANWIKALLGLAGICAVIVLLDAAGDIVSALLHRLLATRTVIEPPGIDATSDL
ncbi:hypothetical protein [Streptomyces sp. AM6-12]|uniref:hypothetical protein n=1 Tax=Streptomyces sp. AM6-12 TaxID=3345149 RepID=UPI00379CB742